MSTATLPLAVASDAAALPSTRFRLGYRPWLDGLRGIAIICVFLQHVQFYLFDREPVIMPLGGLGVDIFFVLSGFLITSLLIEDFEKPNGISFRNFYVRRALRLLPALFLFLIGMSLYSSLSPDPSQSASTGRFTIYAILYATNWLFAGGADSTIFGHLWSLAIEEQFYLVWPLLLALVLRSRLSRRMIAALIAVAIVLICLNRVTLISSGATVERIYFGSDTRFDSLLVGCLVAVIISSGIVPHTRTVTKALKTVSAFAVVIVTAYLFDAFGIPSGSMYRIGFTVFAVFVGLFILSVMQADRGLCVSVLEWRALVWLGKISYSLYLWHVFAIALTLWLPVANAARALMSIPVAICLAALSHYFVERPFLKLKSRYAVNPERVSFS